MAKRYRDSKGRFITKAEYERRQKIAASLKRYYREKKEIERSNSKKPVTRKRPKKDVGFKHNNKTTPKRKKTANKSSKPFKTKRTRTKVKAFPEKGNLKNFFYAYKKTILLNRKIHIKTEPDIDRVIAAINKMEPEIIAFYKKSFGRKRKSRRIDLGYIIELVFSSKDGKAKTVINTTSYGATTKQGYRITRIQSIQQTLKNMIDDIGVRFNEYLQRQGFYSLAFLGIVGELES